MRKAVLASLAVAALLAGGLAVLGRAYGVGPFASGAPEAWLYVAIARAAEGRAQEIEVLDLASGERRLFASGERRVLALALSPDRRTLFVGSDGGAIAELDAVRGVFLRELRLSTSGEVQRLIALPRGGLVALSAQVLESSLALVDLGRGAETARLDLGRRLVGKPALLDADRALVPVADRAGADTLLTIRLAPLAIERETPLLAATGSALQTVAPAVARLPDGGVAALSPFALRLVILAPGEGSRRELDLGRLFFVARPVGFQGDLELAADGTVLHVCLGGALLGERYRVVLADLAATRSGSECGVFARGGDGALYLGVRGKPELRVLDPLSGASLRTLPLAGLPLRLVGRSGF